MRQTFHEGLALDSLAFEVRKREYVQQHELAWLFDWLLADEIFHAQAGLKWSRFLCDGDEERVRNERSLAHDYFLMRVKEARARFVATNPEAALAEVEHLDSVAAQTDHPPFAGRLNVAARVAAGFTEEDMQQIVDWGYVPES